MCHLVVRDYIRWQHLSLFMYTVQLYKEDWGILHMLGCQAIALPSTEQIVNLPCSFQLNCLHQVVLFIKKQECSLIKVLEICSIGSGCPICHKIGNARGVKNLKTRDVPFMDNNV